MANNLKKRRLYERLKERDGLTCGICKQSLEAEWERYQLWLAWAGTNPKPKAPFKRSKLGLSIDHIYPKSHARRNNWPKEKIWDIDNLQLAHMSCNVKKGDTLWQHVEKRNASQENGSTALSATSPMDSSTPESPIGLEKTVTKSASPAEQSESEKDGSSEPRTKAQILKEAMLQYSEGAKLWNSLPGPRLTWPEDKFRIKECYCEKGQSKPVTDVDRFGMMVKFAYCERCGYALPGAYKD